MAASPSPPQPAPSSPDQKKMIDIVSSLRGLAKAYPAASPHIQDALDDIREAMGKIMESTQPGESQAPPIGG